MLEVVGHPAVVNPYRVLLKVARERGWPVLDFVRPVRLRGRAPVTPGRATAAASVSVVLAGAAFVAWRVRQRVVAGGPAPPPPPPPCRPGTATVGPGGPHAPTTCALR